MSRTIVGLFHEMPEAEQTVEELIRGGFSRDEVSIVAHRAKCSPSLGPVESVTGGTGAGARVAMGGIAGFTTGVVALAVPGIGPLIAAGPIAAELVTGGAGAATAAVLGGLKQRGVPEEDAGCFCEAIRRGGILVTVTASDDKAEEAERIIGKRQLVDIEDCAAEWRQNGWKGFDPAAQPVQKVEAALPFDPESIRPSVQAARREKRAVRSYVRVR